MTTTVSERGRSIGSLSMVGRPTCPNLSSATESGGQTPGAVAVSLVLLSTPLPRVVAQKKFKFGARRRERGTRRIMGTVRDVRGGQLGVGYRLLLLLLMLSVDRVVVVCCVVRARCLYPPLTQLSLVVGCCLPSAPSPPPRHFFGISPFCDFRFRRERTNGDHDDDEAPKATNPNESTTRDSGDIHPSTFNHSYSLTKDYPSIHLDIVAQGTIQIAHPPRQ